MLHALLLRKQLTKHFRVTWHDAEVIKNKNGKPIIVFRGRLEKVAKEKGIESEAVDISLSHDDYYAIATIIINN